MTKEEAIEKARELYTLDTDDIEIGIDPRVSYGDGGAWVEAWVWVGEE